MTLAADLARWLVFPQRDALPETVGARLRSDAGSAELAQVAGEQGLLALLHYRAREARLALPPALSRAAADAYHANLGRTTYYYRELARVLATARAAGSEPVVLKGAHLAATLYPALATRPMMDVDLLVPRAEIDALVRALGALGLHEIGREPRARLTHEYEIQTLVGRRGEREYCRFALHWDLLDAPYYQGRLPIEAMCARAVPCELPGMRARVLAPEDLVVYLATHAVLHHQWSRQIWLCDLALLLADPRVLDWERVAALARECTLTLALTTALRRVCDDFALTLPERAWSLLDATPISAKERSVLAELSVPGRGAGRRFVADLRDLRGVRARAFFALGHLFPSPAYMRRRYAPSGPGGLPLAYLRRWLNGIGSLRARAKRL